MPSQKYMFWCIAYNEKLSDVEFYYHLYTEGRKKKAKTPMLTDAYTASAEAYRVRWNDAREALLVFLRENPMPAVTE